MGYFHHKSNGRKGFSHHWYKCEGCYHKMVGFMLLFFERSKENTVWARYEPLDFGSLVLIRLGYFMLVLHTPFPHFVKRFATTLRHDRFMRERRTD